LAVYASTRDKDNEPFQQRRFRFREKLKRHLKSAFALFLFRPFSRRSFQTWKGSLEVKKADRKTAFI
jgi:hypothetical protein